jgi:IS30 family transposase
MVEDNEEPNSQKYIAKRIWVSEWTISNELKRFKQQWIAYDADIAQKRTEEKRMKTNKDIHTRKIEWTQLEAYIIEQIERHLSPEQIANTWNVENSKYKVWHSRLYSDLFGIEFNLSDTCLY